MSITERLRLETRRRHIKTYMTWAERAGATKRPTRALAELVFEWLEIMGRLAVLLALLALPVMAQDAVWTDAEMPGGRRADPAHRRRTGGQGGGTGGPH